MLSEEPEGLLRAGARVMRPSLIAAHLALYEGRLGRCEQLLLPLRERILEQGEESELPMVSYALGWSACWRGDLELASAYAQEAIETAARIESDSLRCQALGFAAVTSAYRGETEPQVGPPLTTAERESRLAAYTTRVSEVCRTGTRALPSCVTSPTRLAFRS